MVPPIIWKGADRGARARRRKVESAFGPGVSLQRGCLGLVAQVAQVAQIYGKAKLPRGV